MSTGSSAEPSHPASVASWIASWRDPEVHGERTAWRFEGDEVTYRAFAERIDAVASALFERGVRPGDRVSWVGLNRIELFETLFGCAQLGAIFNPLNNRLTATELAALLTDAEPRLVLTTDGFAATLREAVAQSGIGAPVIDIDSDPLPAKQSVDEHTGWPAPDPEAPLLMVFTSGTTGRAKGAVLSHRAVARTVENGVVTQGLGIDDVIIAPLPTFHVGGINIQTLPTLAAGGTVVLMRRFDPVEVLELIATQRPTQSLLVPAMLTAVAGLADFATTDLSSLRGVMSGSSVVPDAVTAPWFNRGVPIGQVYGTTETGPTAVVLEYDDAAAHPGSAGRVVAPAELRIVDETGAMCPPGTAGEILLRGENILSEYWRNPQATDEALVDGWYHTGDVGHVDGDGWLTVSDRLRDMIISGGENVYPAEVEAVLSEHPAIAEVAVVGRADERFGEIGVALVVPSDAGDPPTLDQIREWAGDKLARFKHPRELVVVDALPRTALGKVTKHILRDRM